MRLECGEATIFFLLGLLVLILIVLGLRELGRAPPARVAAMMRQGVAGIALFAAALMLARGQLAAALALAGVALAALGRNFSSIFAGKRGPAVDMEFDDFGVRDGAVRSGPFAGSKLSELSKAQCLALYAQCRGESPAALMALEAYFDRRFPGWRVTAQDDADAGRGGGLRRAGEMSEQEAYETLGLRWGASADEIVRAHRTLMKERHPDHGGTTDDAARLNQAKDRLLRRHG